jgi:hypothetical protein
VGKTEPFLKNSHSILCARAYIINDMRKLLSIIQVIALAFAYCVPKEAFASHERGCDMACCAEFAADGCFCEASETSSVPTSAPSLPVERSVLASPPSHASIRTLSLPAPDRVASGLRSEWSSAPRLPQVGLPVLFCTFLI